MEALVQKMIDVVRECGQVIVNADHSAINHSQSLQS